MATKGRIPIPKSQKEISNSLITPYEPLGKGNPNPPISTDLNRGEKVSFRGDTTKPFNLGIQDIDEAIFYYFNNVIRPFVTQNGQRISVPIKYGNPEKWKDIQKDGYYRDDKGKIMAPLIVVARNSMVNEKLLSKLDANNPNNYDFFQKTYTKQNAYNKFNVLNNSHSPNNELYAVVIPDFVTIAYSCLIYTYYTDQLNKIIESVKYAANSYWGDPERFKFKATIDNFQTSIALNDGQERAVKSSFTINMYGYIIPDAIQKDLNSIKKYNSKSKVTFSLETTSNPDVYNPNPQVTEDGRNRLAENVTTRKRLNDEE